MEVRCGTARTKATTPVAVRVPRRALPCDVALSKEGHAGRVVTLGRRVSRKFWMNLLWMPSLAAAAYAGGESDCNEAGFLCTTREEDAVGFFVLGIIPGGIGMAVDAASGAMYQRLPESIKETLPAQ